MILNTGNRTDIPAYYSEWFYNRIKEGYVCARNPYCPEKVHQFSLSPEVVDVLVFCTKNPTPMLARIDEIQKFSHFWSVTITPYGRDVEPFVPPKEEVMKSLEHLSRLLGPSCVSWRYDPIFLTDKYSFAFHIEMFERMAAQLSGSVDNCVISFLDLYEKTKKNFPGVGEVSADMQEKLVTEFVKTGRHYGISIRTCCEGEKWKKYGVDTSGCLSKETLERAVGCELEVPGSVKYVRAGCECLLGNDIGMYNTCGHGCRYCYANYDMKSVCQNMCLHDPKSPFLIGWGKEGDEIKIVEQKLWQNGQIKFDFTGK